MRIVQLGSEELNAHKSEVIEALRPIFDATDEDIEQCLVCDECGVASQRMLRIEVGASRHPHDICAACLQKGVQMLSEAAS